MGSIGYYLIWIIDAFFVGLVISIIIKNLGKQKFVLIIKEFILTLLFVTIIVNITGMLLDRVTKFVSGRAIYAIYPAIIATVGGVGSIIGSTAFFAFKG